jgi:biopolymer transport protein ExbD
MLKSSKICLLAFVLLTLPVGFSCSQFLSKTSNSNSGQSTRTESAARASLINGEDDTDWFELTDREIVLLVSADNKLYREEHSPKTEVPGKVTKTEITSEQLAGIMDAMIKNEPPDRREIYLNADDNIPHEKLVQVMDLIRKADIDRVGLIAVNEDRAGKRNAGGFEVKLPAEPSAKHQVAKPNPLTIVAQLRPDGRLLLNGDDEGKISDTQKLEQHLKDIFRQREENAVFRPDTDEIEKTIFLKAPKSAKYIEVLKLLSALRRSGAQPIGMQLDDLE